MNEQSIRRTIESGRAVLGIELGSTRIKAVLIDENHDPIAAGNHEWENRLENGLWTYALADVWAGLQDSYARLRQDVQERYGVPLTSLAGIGISAMMHGYLPFDAQDTLLAPFRTWRNTNTGRAAAFLTERMGFNIPLRWSIAHLYQAILDGEEHVGRISFLTTLAGYVHWKLTGRKVLGIGDASGMFPIDSSTNDYDAGMMQKFEEEIAPRGFGWKLRDILPEALLAGEEAGCLTEEGAKLLDPSGNLPAGIPLCPPEGDGGTGMVATNSVAPRTGNVSAGTSLFAMVVLERALSKVYPEIDMVTTPAGKPVAMAHCNNCTSDLNAWVGLFGEFAREMGLQPDAGTLFGTLYRKALEGDADCGGLMAYNYVSGEPVTGLEEGRPLFMRLPDARFSLANFMRAHLYAALGALKLGMNILLEQEKVTIDQILGHGGLFKTKGVGQRMMAAALGVPVSVMETAGEGGAWGIALLAAYLCRKADGQALESYLSERVFADKQIETMSPDPKDEEGFAAYMSSYIACLPAEKAAAELFR